MPSPSDEIRKGLSSEGIVARTALEAHGCEHSASHRENVFERGLASENDAPSYPQESAFAVDLRKRIENYFVEQKLSPKANRNITIKIVIGLGLLGASFIALYTLELHSWSLLLVYLLLGVAQIFLILNVAHDSIHNAISYQRTVNVLLAYIYDACGVSSYLVRILHNGGHHSCINLLGEDDPLGGRRVFRFTRHAPRKTMHRFQHLYALFFYSLFSLDYVFVRDFEDLFFPSLPYMKQMKHRVREYFILFGGKLLYLTYMIGLPIVLLGHSPLFIILGFLLMHFVVGLAVAIVFAPTHILECNSFPESRTEYEDYVHHIFATTSDYATESRLVTWLTGGLNHHIVHHICPHVCHAHYPRLTRIVKETAAQYQVPYKEQRTMLSALGQHFSLLKRLGSETSPLEAGVLKLTH